MVAGLASMQVRVRHSWLMLQVTTGAGQASPPSQTPTHPAPTHPTLTGCGAQHRQAGARADPHQPRCGPAGVCVAISRVDSLLLGALFEGCAAWGCAWDAHQPTNICCALLHLLADLQPCPILPPLAGAPLCVHRPGRLQVRHPQHAPAGRGLYISGWLNILG